MGMGPVARAAGRAAAAHGDGGRVVRRAEGPHRRAVEHPDGEARGGSGEEAMLVRVA